MPRPSGRFCFQVCTLGAFVLFSVSAGAQAPDPAPVREPAGTAPAEPPAQPPPEPPAGTATPEPTPPADPQPSAPQPAPGLVPETAPPGAPPPPPQSSIPDGEAPKKPVAPAFPPLIPGIDFGARLRAAIKVQSAEDPVKLDDVSEQLDADMYMSGQIHRMLKWQVGVTMGYTGAVGSSAVANVQLFEVIGRLEPLPEFNIWIGRMLVVADRFAPSGPWGMDEFFFPGFFPLVAAPALPKSGPLGRDVGATIWGAPLKGHLKYYLGAFNLYDVALNPLLAGRIQVSLLNPEPNFYHRTTYFGTKDLISVGVGGQFQKDGSVFTDATTTPPTVLTDDFAMVTADATIEKNIGESGTISAVGGFSKFSGDYQVWDNYWLASLGYMLPQTIGIGKLRTTLRYQRGLDTVDGAEASSVLDAQLSYNVHAWFARFALGYRRGDTFLRATMAKQASNMLYLGVTLADP
jgi:hypothetical protein